MKIGIIGQGFVGSAVREGLKKFYKVKAFDIDSAKCYNLSKLGVSNHDDLVRWADILFVCLPTPMRKDGSCDTRLLEKEIAKIDDVARNDTKRNRPIIIIKSTVPPGTTRELNSAATICPVLFSPEFLTEANSFEDFKNQTRIIIGGNKNYYFKAAKKVKQMFRKPFPSIPIVITEWQTAEMIKYFTNCFLATKVTFANQMYQICLDNNLDYDKVTELALFDDRIGKSHLAVPGPDGDLGFGGHCFPKDLAAMIAFGAINNGNTEFLQTVQDFNDKCRRIRDWEQMKGRAVSDD